MMKSARQAMHRGMFDFFRPGWVVSHAAVLGLMYFLGKRAGKAAIREE